ncbi:hypothetical protein [Streptomyces sp. NPDC047028]|uniref:hypothetical protein n=1 Tax=Streptomyces sp. NPDC047028 TaxID=3155793 RepID=UPI0033EA7463
MQRALSSSGAIGTLAASAASTVSSTLGRMRRTRRSTSAGPSGDAPPPYSAGPGGAGGLPAYSENPGNGFAPRALTEHQLDQLVRLIIPRITRQLRTELRMDRERIGRLRDPRH